MLIGERSWRRDMQQNDKTQHEIRKIAYDLWIKDGQPEGRDREHWEAAKEISSTNPAIPERVRQRSVSRPPTRPDRQAGRHGPTTSKIARQASAAMRRLSLRGRHTPSRRAGSARP